MSALVTALRKFGYVVEEHDDSVLKWKGLRCKSQMIPEVDTYEDHRMAMAFAPAAIRFPGIVIDDAQVVSKSYPDFWQHLREAGFSIEEV